MNTYVSEENPVRRWKKSMSVLSEHGKSMEGHVKERYVQTISVVRMDLASLPSKQFHTENLLPVESTDFLSF